MSNTNIETYTVGDLVDALDEDSEANRRIEVPKFQRRLTWSKTQQRGLIQSIHDDYPIGSILLYKRPADGEVAERLQIVDGLQRTNTLQSYVRKPLYLAPATILPDESLAALLGALEIDVDVESARHRLETWMRSEVRVQPESFLRLLTAMAGEERESWSNTASVAANSVVQELQTATDIRNYKLPVVVYSGDRGNLPEIFELVNTRGTQLNKYQIFAATWVESGTHVGNAKIREAVQDKYAELSEAGFEVEDYDDGTIRDHNLFEYLFGLGKILASKHPLLFKGKDSPAETEPAAFAIATVCSGLQLGKMAELPEHMPRSADELIDPSEFEEALLEACEAVEEALRPYVNLKLNSQNGVPVAHSELQMVSWISRFFVGRWSVGPEGVEERANWKADWAALKESLPGWYLRDIISSHWRGPTYSILDERVWDRGEGSETRPSRTYTEPMSEARFRQDMQDWFDDQLEREQRTRAHVRSSERLFLRFLYCNRVSVFDDQGESFEIEHLFPVKRLKDFAKKDERGWPISCISNLALFTKATNRESGAKTISEFLETLPEDKREEVEQMLDRYLLADLDAVAISGSDFDRDEYEEFLKSRWDVLLNEVVELVPLAAE